MNKSPEFGQYVRRQREAKPAHEFSLRRVAGRVGIEPSYLSKIERGQQPPPGEETIRRLAKELGEDTDVLLALAGKVSTDLLDVIRKRPALIAELLRTVRHAPAKRISKAVKEVRDGDW